MRNRNGERGSQSLEFTLIGLPIVFLLFSIANMCFAMLTLHTIQEAVEQGARYVVTHGSTCASGTNACTVKVQDVAGVIASNAAGVSSANLNVSLIPASGTTVSCNPVSTCLASCASGCSASRTNQWPATAAADNDPGKDIVITADCTVTAPILMFWPGTGGSKVTSTNFHAYTRQRLMF